MPVAGGKEDMDALVTLQQSIGPLVARYGKDNTDAEYQQYLKRVGAKAKVATPDEYSEIRRRLAQRIGQPQETKKKSGYRMGGGYAEYMRQTAQPSLQGAGGDDLTEVQKALYGK